MFGTKLVDAKTWSSKEYLKVKIYLLHFKIFNNYIFLLTSFIIEIDETKTTEIIKAYAIQTNFFAIFHETLSRFEQKNVYE